MLAVYGTLVAAVTVIVFAAAVVKFRDPNRPEWMRNGVVEQATALGFTIALAIGIGLVAQFAFTFKNQSFGVVEGGLIVAIVVAAVLAWRWLRPVEKLRAFETAAPSQQGKAAVSGS